MHACTLRLEHFVLFDKNEFKECSKKGKIELNLDL